jgi:DNA-binding CsgD family transcriptional regulator
MPEKRLATRNREDCQPLVLPEAAQQRAMGPSLSRREVEVLQHVAIGQTSKEIARALGIAERTVNWHIERAFMKLGAGSRAEAVAIAIETGVLRRPYDSRTEA